MLDDSARASDLELIERMRAVAGDSSAAVWLLVPLASIGAGILYGEAVALGALVGSFALCALVLRLRERVPRIRRARLAEREYRRRFRLHELRDYEDEAIASLAKPGAPEVVLLFSGTGLPHGMHHFVRVDLGERPRLQIRRTPLPVDLLHADNPAARLFRYDQPLSAEQTARVQRVVSALTPELGAPTESAVRDGFPCAALVLRRGAEPLWTKQNLASLSPHDPHPIAQLLRMFLELEREVSAKDVSAH